jgi:hypothetical protein
MNDEINCGNAISQKISYGDVEWERAIISGGINDSMTLVAFLGLSQAGIFDGATWMNRFVDAVSISALSVGVSGYLASLPIPNVNGGRTRGKSYDPFLFSSKLYQNY